MVAILYRMASGIPGNAANRIEAATIEAMVINTTSPPNRYGDPVAVATVGNLGVRPAIAAADVTAIVGFLVRPYPTTGMPTWPADLLPATNLDATTVLPPAGFPAISGICSVMRRGYISVAVAGPVIAVKWGPVYFRTSLPLANIPLGCITADPTGGTLIPHTFFQGPQDAQGNCEISVFVGPQ